MNLEKRDNRYVTIDVPDSLKYLKIRKSIEGGARRLVDNRLSFAATDYNLGVWRSVFPDSVVILEDNNTIIETLFQSLRDPFRFKREPTAWQKAAFEKSKDKRAYAYSFETGLGKTKALLDYCLYNYCKGNIDNVIVVTLNYGISFQWKNSSLEKDVNVPYKSFLYNPKKKPKSEFDEFCNEDGLKFFIINIDALKTEKGNELVSKFVTRRTSFVIDEIHLIKNGSSGNHKAVQKLAKQAYSRLGLSATLIGNNLVDAFYIFNWLDPNILGHKYVTSFKRKYCELRFNGFGDEIVGYKNVEEFNSRIEPYVSVMTKKAAGLKENYSEFSYELTKEQKQHIKELRKEWKTKLDNGEFATASIALAARLKIRQVSSGFLVNDDGTIVRIKSNKVKFLKDLLQLHEGKKIFIWVCFKEEAKILLEELPNSLDFSGNVSQDERLRNKERFINDPSILYAVGTPNASGTGLDEIQTVCKTAIFFSNGYSRILRTQAEGRTCRLGGENEADYIDMIGIGSDDRHTKNILDGKEDLNKMTFGKLIDEFYTD